MEPTTASAESDGAQSTLLRDTLRWAEQAQRMLETGRLAEAHSLGGQVEATLRSLCAPRAPVAAHRSCSDPSTKSEGRARVPAPPALVRT
jgi:hypothetical protein